MKKSLIAFAIAAALLACKSKEEVKTIGTVERLDPALDALITGEPKVEVIADGFEWSEGPLWVESQKMLLFSDVPTNTVYKWTPEKGKEVYLTPSGYTGNIPRGGEMGSNGLTLSPDGRLVLAQHGDRRIALMDAGLNTPAPKFTTLADNFQGKKLSSPNDVVFAPNGDIFFTDPPYGLPKQADDTTRETPFNGVYHVSNGTVKLVCDSLTRPNGIAVTPDGKTLIVANSDGPPHTCWYAFDIEGDSTTNARIFFNASENAKTDRGAPDGFKIDSKGNIYASGPGGVWIFDKDAKVLGRIRISEATSNVALSADEKTLYLTCDMYVARIKLRD